MLIAIVGSRKYPSKGEVVDYINRLPPEFKVVSGGAVGVDTWAEEAAKARGMAVVVHRVTDELVAQLGPKVAPLKRNELIVRDCDKLVAFWDVQSHGTAHAIRLAMMDGKLLKIFTPFGVLRVADQKHDGSLREPSAAEVNTVNLGRVWVRLQELEEKLDGILRPSV
jgi:hypothetical protein